MRFFFLVGAEQRVWMGVGAGGRGGGDMEAESLGYRKERGKSGCWGEGRERVCLCVAGEVCE